MRVPEVVAGDLNKLIETSRRISWGSLGRKIFFYAPSMVRYQAADFENSWYQFPAISITGTSCALKCKHCGGKLLKTMYKALTPEELYSLCEKLVEKGCLGCLITGGCTPDGAVPLLKFLDVIARVKKELGIGVVVHTGLIGRDVARGLKKAEVDAALLDVIGCDETINEVYRLTGKTVRDYEKTLRFLKEEGVPTVPHVLVGLHYGRLKGEFRAIDLVARYEPEAVVIIVFRPFKATEMEGVSPPAVEDVLRVLAYARFKLPYKPVVLGCMRPGGRYRRVLDAAAVKAGVNAIAYPSESAVKVAERFRLDMVFVPVCCSYVYKEFR